jgi:hypothetical protein
VNERTQAEIHTTQIALGALVVDLRQRGYDARLWVEDRGDHFTVEIRVRVPPLGVPIEAVA